MIRDGFTKLLIGFIFLFDFRLQGFDILPDPIAYLFIFFGMTSLIGFIKEFNSTRFIAIFLLFTSIPDMIQDHNPSIDSVRGFHMEYDLYFFIGIITSLLSLILLYSIFMGISKKATIYNNHDLASLSKLSFILSAITTLAVYFMFLMMHIILITGAFLGILIIIIGFFNFVLQFVVIIKARDAFSMFD